VGDANEYGPATYGDRIADRYDAMYGDRSDVARMVDRLVVLAEGGPVLELGIGTGRVALPLAERGVEVHGIDASEAMVTKLRAKPGGERIPVTIGDFAEVPVSGRFALVTIPFNTFFALTTQEAQLRCMSNVAAHLIDGGRFVIEAYVPDLGRYQRGQGLTVEQVTTDGVILAAHRHDRAAQVIESQRMEFGEGGVRFFPVRVRYAWPAGLDLEHRWESWEGAPFSATSDGHISIYRRPG
jgi:SAM-dependent methyltransferase